MKIALVSPRSTFLGRNDEFNDFLKQSPEMEFYRQYWSGLGSGLLVIDALTRKDVGTHCGRFRQGRGEGKYQDNVTVTRVSLLPYNRPLQVLNNGAECYSGLFDNTSLCKERETYRRLASCYN